MSANDTRLMKALRGEPTDGVPFWEVWFAMRELALHLTSSSDETEPRSEFEPIDDVRKRVILAQKLGWEYLTTWIPGHTIGAKQDTASDGTSHYVQRGKVPLEELQSLTEQQLDEARDRLQETVTAARDEGVAVVAYVPWCFHAANTGLGLEHLSYLAYDDPDYVHDLFEWIEEGTRRAIREVILPIGADVILFDGDCAYKTGLMMRPDMFREFVFDRTAKTVAPLREAGIHYTFHSDGKVDDFLPMLIELGFSGVHGIESQANDLADVKRRFGRDITLIGNMDIVYLTHASVEEVRAATERMLAIGMEGGKYIAACNTSPMDYIPFENYLAMVEVIKQF